MNAPKPLSQKLRILEMVKDQGFSVLDARSMSIMNPSQRISDLRKLGHPIDTIMEWRSDEHGHMHRVAVYVWNPQQKRQTELWN